MADADEDAIPRTGPDAGETDLSDETQDFRFLASITGEEVKIPKRGEKDFEPHETALQSNILAASRAAMHGALSYPRIHTPKKYTLAIYHPETNMAYAEDPKGPLFKSMGKVYPPKDDPLGVREANVNRLWLLPEEILYLLERGTVDVRWPAEGDEEDGLGAPMSLQGAYAAFIGMEDGTGGVLTFERYSVYAGLRRAGYMVHRAPSWDGPGNAPGGECLPPLPGTSWSLGLLSSRLRSSFWRKAGASSNDQISGPLAAPSCYRSYAEIYRRLALVPFYDPALRSPDGPDPTDPNFRITYHVYKPGSPLYKKSDPGPPDFRIAVVNARETCVPTLAQLGALLDTTPYVPPREDMQLYQKLRHGYKSIILAIVDQGVTSYLRLADSGIGREKLFDRVFKPGGGKRGGGNRGGGKRKGR